MNVIRAAMRLCGVAIVVAFISPSCSRVSADAAVDREVQTQRFGEVVVLYGRYEVVIQSGGPERTLRGRLTEMFVRRDGRWVHPGWRLDLTASPPLEPRR